MSNEQHPDSPEPEIVPEIASRHARRAFSDMPVSEPVIARLKKAASLAPSCFNNQPWRYLYLRGDAANVVHSRLSSGNYWVRRAPLVVLAAARLEDDCRLGNGRDYALFDTGLSVSHLLLQAEREGLYAHPIAGFMAEELARDTGLPEDYILVTVLAIGYPGDTHALTEKHRALETRVRVRRPLRETSFDQTWELS